MPARQAGLLAGAAAPRGRPHSHPRGAQRSAGDAPAGPLIGLGDQGHMRIFKAKHVDRLDPFWLALQQRLACSGSHISGANAGHHAHCRWRCAPQSHLPSPLLSAGGVGIPSIPDLALLTQLPSSVARTHPPPAQDIIVNF